ncbi:MAG: UDP-2,4-diacetamido-2,4,6-trideoxy-beta-L-altropyranose hydrolase, partial [Ilumatobacteraceae bacterium]
MTFGIRVDSSARIGTGHLVRSLTLANKLRSRGEDVIFLSQSLDNDMSSLVTDAGFEVLNVDTSRTNHESPEARDALESLRLINSRSINRVILDHYDLSLGWEEQIGKEVDQVFVIDDLTNRRHRCDLLLNQNLVPPHDEEYASSSHGARHVLVGPKFALLQDEYASIRSIRSGGNSRVERISVFMGGSDPDNATELVLRSLDAVDLKGIVVDVVIGRANFHRTQLLQTFGRNPAFTFQSGFSSLAALFGESDLAIGAGGTTNWERMCLGIPSIVVDIAENQREICVELARAGLIEYLGGFQSVRQTDIQNAIEKLRTDQDLRYQFSWQGQIAVDGLGAHRVVETLLPSSSNSLSLRRTRIGDMSLYFNWVNEFSVRQNSINFQPIPWHVHEAWFKSRIDDPTCQMYVLCADDLPIGQIRFGKNGEEWTIDYSLDEIVRGRGWGKILVG